MRNYLYFAFLGFSVIGCSSGTTGTDRVITDEEYDDTAQAIGGATAEGSGGGDVGAMADVMIMARGSLPLGLALDTDGHIRGSRFGIDVDYTLACRDLENNSITCGETTNRVDATLAIDGSFETPHVDLAVSRTGAWTIDGMQSTVATLDGNGSFDGGATVRSVFRPGDVRQYAFHYDGTYEAVAIGTQNHDVVGGSASFNVDAERTVTIDGQTTSTTFSVDADVTFEANRTATVVLDGTRSYAIDLDTGAVVRLQQF